MQGISPLPERTGRSFATPFKRTVQVKPSPFEGRGQYRVHRARPHCPSLYLPALDHRIGGSVMYPIAVPARAAFAESETPQGKPDHS